MFVDRDALGRIVALYFDRQREGQEELPAPDARAAFAVDAQDRLVFELLLDQENRLRRLEALADPTRPPSQTTRAAFRAALIARWKALNS